MENIIEYYYNIKIDSIRKNNDIFIIRIKKSTLVLEEIFDIDNINVLNTLSKNININTIIPNKYNELYTSINNKKYALIKINKVSIINLLNISNLSNINILPISILERNNWESLWSTRVDFLEEYISQNNKKYPLIRESSDYFIGLTENAISYLVNTKKEVVKDTYLDRKVISHKHLSSLYDPFNIIFDHKARDVAEYIKYSFFINNSNIYHELDDYFKTNYCTKYGIMILFSRVLFPNFYFNTIDKIITKKSDISSLNNIIEKAPEYEEYLYHIYLYLSKYYDIPIPLWLKKNKDLNPRL